MQQVGYAPTALLRELLVPFQGIFPKMSAERRSGMYNALQSTSFEVEDAVKVTEENWG